jgi:pyruvate kinase
VANAVLDGSDAVMLSGESAVGKYPARAVEAMAEVIEGAETYMFTRERGRDRFEGTVKEFAQAIAHAVMYTANHMDVEAIVALTESGSTPLWMSRVRSDIPVFAFTRHEATLRRVSMYRGVYAVAFDEASADAAATQNSLFDVLLKAGSVLPGDLVVLTKGDQQGVAGRTNSMQILTVPGAVPAPAGA